MRVFEFDIEEEVYGKDNLWIIAATLQGAKKFLRQEKVRYSRGYELDENFVSVSFDDNWPSTKLIEAGIDVCIDFLGYKLWGDLPLDISEKTKKLKELLNNLKTDFELLQEGDWEPDYDSCECSIDAVCTVMQLLNIKEQ